jgi:hypothetical protein
VSQEPDFERIAELARRLDEICREAEEIRTRIESHQRDPAPWPDRRRAPRLFEEEEIAGTPRKPETT